MKLPAGANRMSAKLTLQLGWPFLTEGIWRRRLWNETAGSWVWAAAGAVQPQRRAARVAGSTYRDRPGPANSRSRTGCPWGGAIPKGAVRWPFWTWRNSAWSKLGGFGGAAVTDSSCGRVKSQEQAYRFVRRMASCQEITVAITMGEGYGRPICPSVRLLWSASC